MPATRPRRPRRLLLLAAVAAAVLTVAGACDPAPTATPPAGSTATATTSTDYRIARRDADGKIVRWNPCQPVRFVINLKHAPSFAFDEVRRAAIQIENATGIDMVYKGTTTLSPIYHRLHNALYWGQEYSPILISFATADEFPFASATASGYGDGKTAIDSTGHRQYVSGIVVLRPGGWTEGTTSANPLSVMLMHELGHVMGLAHSPTIHEVMGTGGNGTMRAWGAGDLAGLAKLGRGAGCLPTIS